MDSGRLELKRNLGLHHGIAVICGLVIGSGIYISPGVVLDYAGSPGAALIIWVFTGFMGTMGALSFAELGTTFPSGGEKYEYLQRMYGPYSAFLYLWMYLTTIRPGSNAIKCIVVGQYILQPFYPECAPPHQAVILFAVCLASLLSVINCVNVKVAIRGQTLFTACSVIALITITVTGIVYMAAGLSSLPSDMFAGTSDKPHDISLAIYSGIFALWGWNALNFLTEELQRPERNLPLAITISMFLVTLLFALVNLAYMAVLDTDTIIHSKAVAVTFGQATLGQFTWLMSVFIVCSNIGSYNSGMLVGSRLTFVGARNGHLPDVLSLISIKSLSPVVSILFQYCLVVIAIIMGDIKFILNNTIAANTLADFFTMAGMLYLRFKQPNLHRPIKMPLVVPIFFMFCMLFLILIPLITKPGTMGVGIFYVWVTATPAYLLGVKWHSKPKALVHYYGIMRGTKIGIVLRSPQIDPKGSTFTKAVVLTLGIVLSMLAGYQN